LTVSEMFILYQFNVTINFWIWSIVPDIPFDLDVTVFVSK